MSNYTQTTFFTPKDSLPAGNPAKTVFGAAYDVEFGNIATAIASKPDSGSTASFSNLGVTGATPPSVGIYAPSAGSLGFAVNTGQAAGQIAASGAWSIPAPASAAAALSVAGVSGSVTLALTAAAAGSIVTFSDGTHTGAIKTSATAGQEVQFGATSNHGLALLTDATARLTISAAGNVAILAPVSSVALTVTGVAAASTATFASSSGSASGPIDVGITRSASSANNIGVGPNLTLQDTGASTLSLIQHSGGQTEFWQSNGGTWRQVGLFGTDYNLHIRDDGGTMQVAGFRGTPWNLQTANYTLQLSDRGKTVDEDGSAATTVTVPANVFSTGDVVTIAATYPGVPVTIAAGVGMTLAWANGSTVTGNRVLTGNGIATLVFYNASHAYIAGSGLS